MIPITIVILITLFPVQHRGTAGIGMLFGPVTLVWFVMLALLGVLGIAQLAFGMMQTTFFLSRETLVAHRKGGMAGWRQRLFGVMSRNSLQATVYFGIPPNRVVELGMQVQL